jgi:hypothetical protein
MGRIKRKHRSVFDQTPVKAELIGSCTVITDPVEWKGLLKRIAQVLRISHDIQVSHRGYCFRSKESWDSGTGVCYIPETSDKGYTRNDIEVMAATACRENALDYSPVYADEIFERLTWAEPSEVVADFIKTII